MATVYHAPVAGTPQVPRTDSVNFHSQSEITHATTTPTAPGGRLARHVRALRVHPANLHPHHVRALRSLRTPDAHSTGGALPSTAKARP